MFSFITTKISGWKKLPKFIDFSFMIIQLYRLIPIYKKLNLFILYINNFFTNMKLFKYICK